MPATSPIDPDRRLWMTVTSVVGGSGAGLVASVVPFVVSMAPSERASALGTRGRVGGTHENTGSRNQVPALIRLPDHG